MDVYSPIQVLKPVSDNIWIVDGSLITFKGVPFPTRMTVIRLQNGDLFIHSPIELTDTLKPEIDQLGTVKHLISPNRIHYWWVEEWAKAYPDAIKWASPGAEEAAAKQGWHFDKDLEDTPDPAWRDEIDQLIVRGSRLLEEAVFFHKPSKTLILADLIENFESQKVNSRFLSFLMKLAGNLDPDGKLPIDLRLSFLGRHAKLKESVKTLLSWQPEKIILAHGKWYKTNGTAELKRAFRWVQGIT